ncbi:rhodanese-like domain-containing protein [Flammeovirga sp. SJP92]|uniref:rhodanese-like domain-containing protein n=1 Tax=Flammeovirga sp. SJP92 TaxID=1775430 RepID=UPI000789719D|nr:rhodanese-like domain-containing protein [Flammeovirga sp. SJP92]KXX71773.1 NADH oxidase [Flammeovirga sp. SJP92]
MKSITVEEFKELQDSGADFQLIDVREDYEYEEANLGGILIPLATVVEEVEQFSKDKRVIVHCRSGKRSANAIQALESMFGFTNLENLEGGILAYIDEYGLDD